MIKRELRIFFIVGFSTVAVDFIFYRGLIVFETMSVDTAKATGFLAGTLFSYFVNRSWTFGNRVHVPGSAWRFLVLYAITLGANVLVNTLALQLLADATAAIQLAFLLASGVSACLNFIGMKLFVFRQIPTPEC